MKLRSISSVGRALAYATATVCIVAVSGCSTGAPGEEVFESTSDALRKCPDGATLRGIDVSKWQQTVDWGKVKRSGKSFAFARISDGLNHHDAYFVANWSGMKDAGLVRGSYQFFRAAQDPVKQADLVIEKIVAVGGLKPGDLPPVLDFEVDDGVAPATAIARAKTWLDRIERRFGVRPIVYTGNNMNHVTGNHLSAFPLWVPNYGATCPLMPPGWQNWKLWQDSDTGRVDGVNGNCDTNFFNGSLPQLEALTLQSGARGDVALPDEPTSSEEFAPPDPTAPDDGVLGSHR